MTKKDGSFVPNGRHPIPMTHLTPITDTTVCGIGESDESKAKSSTTPSRTQSSAYQIGFGGINSCFDID